MDSPHSCFIGPLLFLRQLLLQCFLLPPLLLQLSLPLLPLP
jgi:hypothetical protein